MSIDLTHVHEKAESVIEEFILQPTRAEVTLAKAVRDLAAQVENLETRLLRAPRKKADEPSTDKS